jgi:hypothetical protein
VGKTRAFMGSSPQRRSTLASKGRKSLKASGKTNRTFSRVTTYLCQGSREVRRSRKELLGTCSGICQ